MKFSLTSLLLISALTFSLAKVEKTGKNDEAIVEPLTDGSGAKSDGGSSDFNIEELLKLIDALKNNDFDEVDKQLKNQKDLGDLKFDKIDHMPEEMIDESDKEKSKDAAKKSSSADAAAADASSSSFEKEMEEELGKMEL